SSVTPVSWSPARPVARNVFSVPACAGSTRPKPSSAAAGTTVNRNGAPAVGLPNRAPVPVCRFSTAAPIAKLAPRLETALSGVVANVVGISRRPGVGLVGQDVQGHPGGAGARGDVERGHVGGNRVHVVPGTLPPLQRVVRLQEERVPGRRGAVGLDGRV